MISLVDYIKQNYPQHFTKLCRGEQCNSCFTCHTPRSNSQSPCSSNAATMLASSGHIHPLPNSRHACSSKSPKSALGWGVPVERPHWMATGPCTPLQPQVSSLHGNAEQAKSGHGELAGSQWHMSTSTHRPALSWGSLGCVSVSSILIWP